MSIRLQCRKRLLLFPLLIPFRPQGISQDDPSAGPPGLEVNATCAKGDTAMTLSKRVGWTLAIAALVVVGVEGTLAQTLPLVSIPAINDLLNPYRSVDG